MSQQQLQPEELHPDFARMHRVLDEADATVEGSPIPHDLPSAVAHLELVTAGLADGHALHHVAEQRVTQAMTGIPPMAILLDPAAVLETIWLDAFLAGVRFQQLGGHVEEEGS